MDSLKGLSPSEKDKLVEQYDAMKVVITSLDEKLKKVLRKQEYEYLQAYNIYVKRKEKELRELVNALNEKNSDNNSKDTKIS